MVGLPEIVRLRRHIKVREDLEIAVTGLHGEVIGELMDRFPAFKEMLAERKLKLTPQEMMKLGGDLVLAFCSAGVEHQTPDERRANEKKLANLELGERLELLLAIFEITFPKGLGPFVTALEGGSSLVAAFVGSGRAPDTRSPSRSNGASPQVIPQPMPGVTPPDSSPAGLNSSNGSEVTPKPT